MARCKCGSQSCGHTLRFQLLASMPVRCMGRRYLDRNCTRRARAHRWVCSIRSDATRRPESPNPVIICFSRHETGRMAEAGKAGAEEAFSVREGLKSIDGRVGQPATTGIPVGTSEDGRADPSMFWSWREASNLPPGGLQRPDESKR